MVLHVCDKVEVSCICYHVTGSWDANYGVQHCFEALRSEVCGVTSLVHTCWFPLW